MTNENWFRLGPSKSEYLRSNLKHFQKRFPEQIENIHNSSAKLDSYEFLAIEGRCYACRTHDSDNILLLYNPRTLLQNHNRSIESAQKFFQRGVSLMIIAGSGLGYLAHSLERNIQKDVSKGLVLVENRPELILAQFCLYDCERLLNSPQLFWAVGEALYSVMESLFKRESLYQLNIQQIVSVPERSLTKEERILYGKLPQWYSSTRKYYLHSFQEKRERFDRRMKEPPDLNTGRIWGITHPDAYAHTPLLRSLMSGFEQQGWSKHILEIKDGFSARFRVIEHLVDTAPDAILVCNTPSEQFINRSIHRPRIVWFLDDPRHYNNETFAESFMKQDHIFYIDRTYGSLLQKTHAGSHHFLPATSSFTSPGTSIKELAAPILFVGSYDNTSFYRDYALKTEWEETAALLEALIQQPTIPTHELMEQFKIKEAIYRKIQIIANDFVKTIQRTFYSDTHRLEYFLYNLANSFKREKYVRALLDQGIVVYGPESWREVLGEKYKNQFKGWMSPKKLADAYASATICLNIHSLQCPTCFNPRDFDILATKGCLLSDWVADMEEEILKPDRDLISFRNEKELVQKIETLLQEHDLRHEISETGYRTFHQRHTPAHRASKILELIR